MTGYQYLDFSLILSEKSDSILPIYIKGSIEQSLRSIFGEIGGLATIELLKFDRKSCRGILKVPEHDYVKIRTALTLISHFQNIRCYFKIHSSSPILLSLVGTLCN